MSTAAPVPASTPATPVVPPASPADAPAAPVSPGGAAAAGGPAPSLREQQRQRTRAAILDATIACLVEDGYGALTTRRVAERAGIAQSTLMHHFAAREQLLVEAVAGLAEQLAATAMGTFDLSDPARGRAFRMAVLEQAWSTFTSPQALAAAQLWGAAWAEPEIALALRDLEVRVAVLITQSAEQLFPKETADPQFPVLIDAVYQIVRGLVMGIPTWGKPIIDARWAAMVPILVDTSLQLIPPRS